MSASLAIAFALGGGAGAVARHAVSLALPTRFPWATLAVNVLGSLALGAGLVVLGAGPDTPAGRCFVGFCGGFTTFSSFAHGTLALHREASARHAAANVALNLAGSVGAFVLGAALVAGLADHGADSARAFAPGTWRELDCIDMTSTELDRATWFGEGDEAATCGLVAVPAERDAPDGRTLEIAVYRVPPASAANPAATRPDPVVYLEGGPGGAGVSLLASLYDPGAYDSVAFLRAGREVIVIDQRGTGYSRPALYCPEVYRAQEAQDGDEVEAHRACRDRHVAAGVHLSDYDSRENAADLETVRAALGIERWNLYGLSYGTRLALTAMRDAPARLRAVVLDSAFPVEVNGFGDEPWTSIDALHRIGSGGGGLADIETGMRRLESAPLPSFGPLDYLELLRSSVADPDVGELVRAVAGESGETLSARLARREDEADRRHGPWPMGDVPEGRYPVEAESADAMYYAVACAEEWATRDAPAMPDLSDGLPPATRRAVAASADFSIDGRICDVYDVPPAAPVESLAVESDVPTLVLAGGADVLTPPAWGRRVAAELTNARYVELPDAPHGVLGNDDCATAVTIGFLDAPSRALPEARACAVASCATSARPEPVTGTSCPVPSR